MPPVSPAPPSGGRAKALMGDTLIFAAGSAIGRAILIILVPLYTYTLTTDQFGLIDLISTTVDLALPFVFLCAPEAVLRFSIDREAQAGRVLGTGLSIMLVGSVLAASVALVGNQLLPQSYHLPYAVGLLLANGGYTMCGAWARGSGHTRAFALSGILQALVLATSNIVMLVVLDWQVKGYLFSLIASYVTAGLFLVVTTKVAIQARFVPIDWNLVRDMVAYAAPLIPNAIMWWLTSASNRYIVATLHDTQEVGLLSLASKVPPVLMLIASVFTQAWQLSAFREADAADRDQYFSKVLLGFQTLLIIGISGLLLMVKPLFALFVAPTYYLAWTMVPGLLLGSLFSNLSGFFGTIFTTRQKTRPILTTTVVTGLTAPVIGFILISRLGGLGASIGFALSFTALWLLRVWAALRVANVCVDWLSLGVSVVVLLAQSVGLFAPNPWAMISQICGFVALLVIHRRTLTSTIGQVAAMVRQRGANGAPGVNA